MTRKLPWTLSITSLTAGAAVAFSVLRADGQQIDAPRTIGANPKAEVVLPMAAPRAEQQLPIPIRVVPAEPVKLVNDAGVYSKSESVLPIATAGRITYGEQVRTQKQETPPAPLPKVSTDEPIKAPIKNATVAPTDAPTIPGLGSASPTSPVFFANADYLLWWVRKGPTPALLTQGDNTNEGKLDQPGTTIVIGKDGLDFGTFSGVRIALGRNFGPEEFVGVEFSGFFLQPRNLEFQAASDPLGSPLFARPFLSANDTTESAVTVSSPDQIRGSFKVHADTKFWGFDANFVAHSIRESNRRFDFLAGFRCLALDEGLRMNEDLLVLEKGAVNFQLPIAPVGQVGNQVTPLVGSVITTLDDFSTTNRFYGGQLGGRFQWIYERWTLDLTGKVAFGFSHQVANISGASTLNGSYEDANMVVGNVTPTTGGTTPGGVLALASNIGNYTRDQFAVVPEVALKVHFDVTPRIRTSLGYNGIYWSAVARPGDQIDRVLNTKLIPTGQSFTESFDPSKEQTRPRFNFTDNGFWAHGLNVGIEFRY